MSLDRLTLARRGMVSWQKLRILERSAMEGALALARTGQGQTLFIAVHEPRVFADRRRIETIEVSPNDTQNPFGLVHDLMRAALTRPEARSLALPDDLRSYVKGQRAALPDSEADPTRWPDAIANFFTSLSNDIPILIMIDQAHRADAESLHVIEVLSRRMTSSHVLLILTHRIDEAPNLMLNEMMRNLLIAPHGHVHALSIAAPHADDGRLLFESAFGRDLNPEKAGMALSDECANLLIHGMTIVEMCRRAGRWADAIAVAERIVTSAEKLDAHYLSYAATISIGHALTDQGKWNEGLERLERIQFDVEESKDNVLIAWLYWGIARANWGISARKAAFQMLRLARTVASRIDDPALSAAIALCGVEWLADHRRLQPAYDWQGWLDTIASQSGNLAAEAALAAANGIVTLAQQDPVSATGFFRSALRHWTMLGNEYTVAHSHRRLASSLLQRDDADSRREGREELVDAHAAYSRLGANSDLTLVEELGAKYGVRPRARRAASSRSASPGGITPREREVLGLLVRGLTNRQIAAELSITEKTAEGHVSNILAKLGVASRVQAAGYAVANGLLEGAEA